MKHTILLSTLVTFFTTAALAENQRTATVTAVEPRYEFVRVNTPVRQCQDVQVPIYGTVTNNGNAGEGALLGMIIGGVIGDAVSGGNGEATAGGAIIGGIIGADRAQNGSRQVVTGYSTERQCSEVMQTTEQRQVRDYRITYEWNGVVGQSYTYNNYYVGQRIPVNITVIAR